MLNPDMPAVERKISRAKEAIAMAIRGYIFMTCTLRIGSAQSGFAEKKALEILASIDAAIDEHITAQNGVTTSRE